MRRRALEENEIENTGDIPILFRNEDFLAIGKAPGISVHNNEDSTNLLVQLEKQLKIPKLFPVHRLDKETSGVQVLALKAESARTMAEEFEKRSVTKIYTGVLRGQLKTQEGVWTKPLTDKAEGRKNPEGISKNRIPSETRFRILKNSPYFSLCEFTLVTGRQHQIRKHAAVVNHQLVGDPRYGDPKYNKKISALYQSDRMYLHCSRVGILGIIVESPLPEEFDRLFSVT